MNHALDWIRDIPTDELDALLDRAQNEWHSRNPVEYRAPAQPFVLTPIRKPCLERDVQRAIMIETSRTVAWFRNTTGHYVEDGRHISYGLGGKGGSDLIGIRRRDGRFVACEVKRPGSKPRPDQVAFLELVNRVGGLGFWADSVEGAVEALR